MLNTIKFLVGFIFGVIGSIVLIVIVFTIGLIALVPFYYNYKYY